MTNIKVTTKTVTIDLKDPENEVILKAKERADSIMEWGVMFHQAHWVFLIASLILVFTPFDQAYFVAIGMFLLCFVIAQVIRVVAKNHLINTIKRHMPRD